MDHYNHQKWGRKGRSLGLYTYREKGERTLRAPRERREKLDRSQCPAKHRDTHWPVKLLHQQLVCSLNSSSLACQITPATVCLFLPKQFIISLSNRSSNKSVYSSQQLITGLSNHSSTEQSDYSAQRSSSFLCQITATITSLFLTKQFIISQQ